MLSQFIVSIVLGIRNGAWALMDVVLFVIVNGVEELLI